MLIPDSLSAFSTSRSSFFSFFLSSLFSSYFLLYVLGLSLTFSLRFSISLVFLLREVLIGVVEALLLVIESLFCPGGSSFFSFLVTLPPRDLTVFFSLFLSFLVKLLDLLRFLSSFLGVFTSERYDL